MSSSARALAIAVCALGALGVAVFIWAPGPVAPSRGGKTGRPDAPAARPFSMDSGAPAATGAPTAVRGHGTLSGEVLLSGAPPAMQPLKLGVDPICAGAPSHDEQVVVREGRLANVFVRLVDAPAQPPPSDRVVIDQVSCVFRPRVQGAVHGQPMEIRNGDRTLHNVHGYAGNSTLFNYAQPASAPSVERAVPEGARVIKLKCDVHPWMTAYVLVNDNSYFAVTGTDGTFAIEGIPAGTYGVEAWHERFGVKAAKVTLREGETARVGFSYSPEDRR